MSSTKQLPSWTDVSFTNHSQAYTEVYQLPSQQTLNNRSEVNVKALANPLATSVQRSCAG